MSDSEVAREVFQRINTAQLGTSVVAVVQLLPMEPDKVDWALLVALYCFAPAIPLLVILYFLIASGAYDGRDVVLNKRQILLWLAWSAPVAGLGFGLAHLSYGVAVAFEASVLVALVTAVQSQRARAATSPPLGR